MSRRLSPNPRRIRLYRPGQRFILPFAAILFVAVVGSYLVFLSSAYPWNNGGGGAIQHTVQPAANPVISQTCTGALNIALVADVSGSINSTEMSQMQTAFKGLVSDLLPGYNAGFSLTEFDTTATVLQNFTSNPTAIDNAIDQLGGGRDTHWDAGLTTGYSTFSSLNSTAPRLLIIATDGDPDPASGLDAAITEANLIKAAGVHILAIGLGSGPNVANMETISGSNVSNDGSNVSINTDVVVSDFSALGSTLLNIIIGGCPAGDGGLGDAGSGGGKNGNGPGQNGNGPGQVGNGPGSNGSSGDTAGDNTGNSSGPSTSSDPTPTPTPSDSATQTTPTPTPTPNPVKAPSSSPTQAAQQPQPAPKPTAQGTQQQPPTITPSPFYDGKQYAPGSAPDNLASALEPRTSHVWWYVISGAAVIAATGGFLAWQKRLIGPAKKPAAGQQPSKKQ